MRWIALGGFLAATAAGQAAKPDPDPRLAVTLADGSQFLAPPPAEAIAVKTEFGEQRIPLKNLRWLRRVSDTEFAIQTPNFSASGEVARKDLEFQSDLGPLQIPLGEIRSITASLSLAVLVDPSTVAAWSLGDSQEGACLDLVKGRRLELHDMELSADKDGVPAIARKGEGSYAETSSVEDMDFTGDFTLEARLIPGSTTRGYTGVVMKNEGTSGQPCDFSVYTQANGQMFFNTATPLSRISFGTPTPVLKPTDWSYLAIVVQPQVPLITLYANGKQVFQVRHVCRTSGGGHPFFLGTCPPYTSFSCPERVQFVRLSKTARKAEEIAELQEILTTGGVIGGASSARGVALRSGGFMRATFPKLTGTRFKTKYGTLELGDATFGQLTIYKYREEQALKAKEEASALVQQLGAARIEDRDDASAKILQLGECAVPSLRDGLKDGDSEIRRRSDVLLKKFDASGVSARPIGDVFRAGHTALYGWLEASQVEVVTKFGTFRPAIQALDRINLGDRLLKGKPVLKLRSGESLQGEPARDTAIHLDTGFGALAIPLSEVLSLTFDPAREQWTIKTERVTASGKIGPEELRLGTPAGAISVPFSEIVQISIP